MAWPGARSLWRIVHPPRAHCAQLCSSLLVAVPPASLRGHCPATGARHGAAKLGDIPRGISKHVGGCWWAPFCPRTMPGVGSSVVPAGRPQHGVVEAPSRWEAPLGRSRSRSTGGAPSEHRAPCRPRAEGEARVPVLAALLKLSRCSGAVWGRRGGFVNPEWKRRTESWETPSRVPANRLLGPCSCLGLFYDNMICFGIKYKRHIWCKCFPRIYLYLTTYESFTDFKEQICSPPINHVFLL